MAHRVPGRRAVVAAGLKKAATGYWSKRTFGVYHELGVSSWGKLKADVVAVNRKGHIVIVEVKSCWADFHTDHKYHKYLPYCNQFYFVFTDTLWASHSDRIVLPRECGVLVLSSTTGLVEAVRPSTNRKMEPSVKKDMVLRMAWRAATYSKYQGTRRTRVFLQTQ